MASLEQILNTVIPIGIVIIFIGIFYWKLKDPIDLIFGIIWKGIVKMFDGIGDSFAGSSIKEVTYK